MAHAVTGFIIEADPDMGIPHALKVLVHGTTELLNDFRRRDGYASTGGEHADVDSVALTTFDPWNEREHERYVMHLSAEALDLAVIAHEATHAALWMYGTDVLHGHPGATAQRHVINHDERIPYLIGNLTALVWYGLRNDGFPVAE